MGHQSQGRMHTDTLRNQFHSFLSRKILPNSETPFVDYPVDKNAYSSKLSLHRVCNAGQPEQTTCVAMFCWVV